MLKKGIKTILTDNDRTYINEVNAIINNNTLIYKENDILVKVAIDKNSVILNRSNEIYELVLSFSDKVYGTYLLKKENVVLNLDLILKFLNIDEKRIEIIYEIEKELKKYEIFY